MGRDTIEGSEETVRRGGDVNGQWPRGCTGGNTACRAYSKHAVSRKEAVSKQGHA